MARVKNNYLHKLEDHNSELVVEALALRQTLANIQRYLQLPKFAGGPDNHWVNPDDIELRICEGLGWVDNLVQAKRMANIEHREGGGE